MYDIMAHLLILFWAQHESGVGASLVVRAIDHGLSAAAALVVIKD
jgi:hypothetical protein